jgi:hypothetical protein
LNPTWKNQISRRRGLRVLACGLVFLGICVFAWGLRYKLSLYDPPHSVSHRIPAAKLLTGKERIEVPALGRSGAASPAGPAALVALTLAFVFVANARLFPGFSGWASRLDPVRLTPSRLTPASCWTRPPPRSR